MIDFLKTLANENQPEKKISEIGDIPKLREAYYWLNIDKYKRKQVNRYLKLYANKDNRWQEAFDEVIYL